MLDKTDRRGFLGILSRGAVLAVLAELLPAGSLLSIASADPGAIDVKVTGAPRNLQYGNEADQKLVDERVRQVLAATFDLDMVKPGHLVVLKVAANSPYPYPFTSHPMVVRSVVRIMKERGANVVIVDQPGFEHVLEVGDNKRQELVKQIWGRTFSGYTSGMAVHEHNGLARVARDEGIPIEAGDNDSDYVHVGPGTHGTDEEFKHWPERTFGESKQPAGFRIHKRAAEVAALGKENPPRGHVISISRPSSHVQAGHTGPIKTWYGWVHTADRLWSHIFMDNVKNGENPYDRHTGHTNWWNPFSWNGTLEVKQLHECIAETAHWFEKNMPLRAHVLGALDTYSDVGPDWGKIDMKSPNVIAASKTALPLDAFMAGMLMDEKAATSREARKWQALRRAPDVTAHSSTPWLRRMSETLFFYGIEDEFHHRHGTHYIEKTVDNLRDKKKRDEAAGAPWFFRQIHRVRELAGGPEAGVKVTVLGGDVTLSDNLKLLIGAPTPKTPGFVEKLGEGMR